MLALTFDHRTRAFLARRLGFVLGLCCAGASIVLPDSAAAAETRWIEETPIASSAYVMVQDPPRARLLLLAHGDSAYYWRTWPVRSGEAWVREALQGRTSIHSNGWAKAFYDPSRDRILIYNDPVIHELTFAPTPRFRQLPARGVPIGPTATFDSPSVSFDAQRSRLLLFGGFVTGLHGFVSSVDLFYSVACGDSAIWTRLPFVAGPSARSRSGSVWDPVDQRLLVLGGNTYPSIVNNDLWVAQVGDSVRWSRRTILGDLPHLADLRMLRLDDGSGSFQTLGRLIPNGPLHAISLANRDSAQWQSGPPPAMGEPATPGSLHSVIAKEGLGLSYGMALVQFQPASRPPWVYLDAEYVRPEWRLWSIHTDTRRDRTLLWSAAAADRFWSRPSDSPRAWSYRGAGSAPPTRQDQAVWIDEEHDRFLTYDPVGRVVHWAPLATFDRWRVLAVGGTPPPARTEAAWAFDPVSLELHVIGGLPDPPRALPEGARSADHHILSFDPTPNWRLVDPAVPRPVGRSRASAIFDPTGERLWLSAGTRDSSGVSAPMHDLWRARRTGTGAFEWELVDSRSPESDGRPIMFDRVRDRIALGPGGMAFRESLSVRAATDSGTWQRSGFLTPPLAATGIGSYAIDPVRGRAVLATPTTSSGTQSHLEAVPFESPALALSVLDPVSSVFPGDSLVLRLEVASTPGDARPGVFRIADLQGGLDARRWIARPAGGASDTLLIPMAVGDDMQPGHYSLPAAVHLAGAWGVMDSTEVTIEVRRWLDPGHIAHVDRNSIDLRWHTSDPAVTEVVVLRRRRDAPGFVEVGRIAPDQTGVLRWLDVGLLPGTEYRYRLLAQPGAALLTSDEVRITTDGALELALGDLDREPMGRPWGVSFTLPSRGRARIEMLDLAGRVRWSSVMDDLAAGDHQVAITATDVRPGIHWVRLSHEGRMLTRRFTLIP